MPKAIEVNNLVKHYPKASKNAVDDVSFSVEEGEFFAFLGPNGAGKTTAISILTTMRAKSSGDVRVAGFNVDTHANEVRRRIGVIFQAPSLDQNLSAEENIRFHASLYGIFPFRPFYILMPNAYKERVCELAGLVGIQDALWQPVRTFSGGMRRKLEIIRSLMHKPRVLFLDEPTTGLDPLSRKNVWEYLQTVRREEKTTIFLTTHYLDEAETADHICIMNNGRIVSSGTAAQIRRDIIASYILLDADDRSSLAKEMETAGIKFNGAGPFKVPLTPARGAQDVIQTLRTHLTVLKIHEPTLEEAYIEIINPTALNIQLGEVASTI